MTPSGKWFAYLFDQEIRGNLHLFWLFDRKILRFFMVFPCHLCCFRPDRQSMASGGWWSAGCRESFRSWSLGPLVLGIHMQTCHWITIEFDTFTLNLDGVLFTNLELGGAGGHHPMLIEGCPSSCSPLPISETFLGDEVGVVPTMSLSNLQKLGAPQLSDASLWA